MMSLIVIRLTAVYYKVIFVRRFSVKLYYHFASDFQTISLLIKDSGLNLLPMNLGTLLVSMYVLRM